MDTSSLTLTPYNKQPFTIQLLKDKDKEIEKIDIDTAENRCVFSDYTYEFKLKYENLDLIKDVRVYINDSYEKSTYHKEDGSIRFKSHERIFIDCYGYVSINLTLIMEDDTEENFSSHYLPVLVRKGQLNESVKKWLIMFIIIKNPFYLMANRKLWIR